jgi:hypothetical protein
MSIASRERLLRRVEGRAAAATSYTADDREAGEFTTDTTAMVPVTETERFAAIIGGNPTVAALHAMWHQRDARYNAQERVGLTDKEVEAIVRFRLREVYALAVTAREKCAMERELRALWDIDHGFPL